MEADLLVSLWLTLQAQRYAPEGEEFTRERLTCVRATPFLFPGYLKHRLQTMHPTIGLTPIKVE